MPRWNSDQYLKYKDERTQPSIDLVRRIDHPDPGRILDVGCGPGNSTEVLAGFFPKARILGIDNSEEMIQSARSAHPGIGFTLCDAAGGLEHLGHFDVVFSNACIQWIPDHRALLKKLLGLLRPGGVLAVQTPMNHNAPIQRIIRELAASDAWKSELGGLKFFHNLEPGGYFDALTELGATFSIWETEYYHVLGSHMDIIEWYRGTGLRPYLQVLNESRRDRFEAEVLERLQTSYPPQQNGAIIFRFRRLFFVARPNGPNGPDEGA